MRSGSFYTICLKVYKFLCSSIKVFIFILCDLMRVYDMCHLVLIYMFMSDLRYFLYRNKIELKTFLAG